MKFPKEDLEELIYGSYGDYEVVLDELEDTSRWRHHYRLVFRHGGRLYETRYNTGATECQDERPFEFDDDEIECQEVEAHEKTVTDYRPVER